MTGQTSDRGFERQNVAADTVGAAPTSTPAPASGAASAPTPAPTPTQGIATIFCDLGGVVFTDGTAAFVAAVAARYGIDPERVRAAVDGEIGSRYRTGALDRDAFWREALAALGVPRGDADALEALWIAGYAPIPGTVRLLAALAAHRPVWFASDNVRERSDALDARFGFRRWFSGGVFSYEVGARKPDPAIYRAALRVAGVLPTAVLFIDDKASALVPAAALGMATIRFVSPEDLAARLADMGLVPAAGAR